jgi:MerR family transcriptional regulator, copper efflux regulator
VVAWQKIDAAGLKVGDLMKVLTIGQAAKTVGLGVETIRFYERKGLIAQPKKPFGSGARDYGGDTVDHLRFISQAKELGFSLAEIAELLELRTEPDTNCSQVRAHAIAKRQNIQTKIKRLQQIGSALDDVISQCPGSGDLADCGILEALESRNR